MSDVYINPRDYERLKEMLAEPPPTNALIKCWCGEPAFRDDWLCKAHSAERLRSLGIEPRWR